MLGPPRLLDIFGLLFSISILTKTKKSISFFIYIIRFTFFFKEVNYERVKISLKNLG